MGWHILSARACQTMPAVLPSCSYQLLRKTDLASPGEVLVVVGLFFFFKTKGVEFITKSSRSRRAGL